MSGSSKTKPAVTAIVVVPSDTVNLADPCRALWVGVLGDISVEMEGAGAAIVFKGVQGLIPISVSRVNATSTDATSIVALY